MSYVNESICNTCHTASQVHCGVILALPNWYKNITIDTATQDTHTNLLKERGISIEYIYIYMSISNSMAIISELLHEFGRRFETITSGPPIQVSPPIRVASVLTTRPSGIHKSKWTPAERDNTQPKTVSRTGLEVSLLDFLHLALAYRYHFCMEERWEHVSMQVKCQL